MKVGRKILRWENDDEDPFAWEDFCDALSEILKKKNPDGNWRAEVTNFGWRGVDGHKEFHAETGENFLQNILSENRVYV